jgi:CHASE2 domain-containing sensor protein
VIPAIPLTAPYPYPIFFKKFHKFLMWLRLAEDWYYDLWHQLAGWRHEPQHVVIVAIDDQTRLEHQDEPLVFWDPHFAWALAVLRQAGPKLLA